MSYTEHPDIDAARWFEEEERKALELEWLIEEESKKECYNPFLIENIVEALCNLSEEEAEYLQNKMSVAKWDDGLFGVISYYSELHQEKRIKENVMKGK